MDWVQDEVSIGFGGYEMELECVWYGMGTGLSRYEIVRL